MRRSKFLSKAIGALAALATMPLGWLAAKTRTTKGIIPYIHDMEGSEYGYDEYLEMTDKIFQYIPNNSPKMLMCVHCGKVVTIPDNCSCGRIQTVYEQLRKIANEAK